MLVVMEAQSPAAEIDAVSRCAREAGFETSVYDGESPLIVVKGEHAAQAAEWKAPSPGATCADSSVRAACASRSGA